MENAWYNIVRIQLEWKLYLSVANTCLWQYLYGKFDYSENNLKHLNVKIVVILKWIIMNLEYQ